MKAFANYARSAAFRVELSPRMIDVLLSMSSGKPYADGRLNIHPYSALARRGLIRWPLNEQGEPDGTPTVTEAGELVAQLLRLANFEQERQP